MEFPPKESLNQYQSSPSSNTYNPTPEDDITQITEPVLPQPRLFTAPTVKEEPGLQEQINLDAVPERIPSFDENIYDAESDEEEVVNLVGSDSDYTTSKNPPMFTESAIKVEPGLRTPTALLYDPARSFDEDECASVGDDVCVETSRLGYYETQCPQRAFSYEIPAIEGELSPQRMSNLDYDPERNFNINANVDTADDVHEDAYGSAIHDTSQPMNPDMPTIKEELSQQRMINLDYDPKRSFNTNNNHGIGEDFDEEINGSAIQYANQRMTPAMPTIKEEPSPLREVSIKHEPETIFNAEVSAYGAESVDDEIAGLVGPVIKRPKLRLKVRRRIKKERSSVPRSPDVVHISPGEFYADQKRPAESVEDEIAGLVEPYIKCSPAPSFSRSKKRRSSRR
jgi:hypothetical protein